MVSSSGLLIFLPSFLSSFHTKKCHLSFTSAWVSQDHRIYRIQTGRGLSSLARQHRALSSCVLKTSKMGLQNPAGYPVLLCTYSHVDSLSLYIQTELLLFQCMPVCCHPIVLPSKDPISPFLLTSYKFFWVSHLVPTLTRPSSLSFSIQAKDLVACRWLPAYSLHLCSAELPQTVLLQVILSFSVQNFLFIHIEFHVEVPAGPFPQPFLIAAQPLKFVNWSPHSLVSSAKLLRKHSITFSRSLMEMLSKVPGQTLVVPCWLPASRQCMAH